MTSAAVGLDRQNPWPGLASFTEREQTFFFGREREAEELLRLVRRETLTVLYGQSGLGKTSLLQAGLFPKLRQEDLLPVFLRLDHTPEAPALDRQVSLAFVEEAGKASVEVPAMEGVKTLWEYFHSKKAEFWSSRQRLLTPVLVFDQFEELMTLGRATEKSRARAAAFLQQLADLIDNRAPLELQGQIERGEKNVEDFDFENIGCKVILSLREDFLADFESLRPMVGGDGRNRMRLIRMTGEQAIAVLMGPGSEVIDSETANRVVRFVAGAETIEEEVGSAGPASAGGSAAEMEIEPALLCLVCRELNLKRLKLGEAKITPGLLSGSRREILSDFYERCFADLPVAVRVFVEDRLLTRSGFRNNVALEDALMADGVSRGAIDTLVSRRLLRLEDRLGVTRVELTHDVLTVPVRASRNARHEKEEIAAAERAAAETKALLHEARRRLMLTVVIAGIIIAVMAVLVGVSVFYNHKSDEFARTALEEKRYAEVQARNAEVSRKQADDEKQRAIASEQKAEAALQRAREEEADANAEDNVFREMLGSGGGAEADVESIPRNMVEAVQRVVSELDQHALKVSPKVEALVRESLGNAMVKLRLAADAENDLNKSLQIYLRDMEKNKAEIAGVRVSLGDALEQERKYREAMQEYEAAAEAGNGSAMNQIGVFYDYGDGVNVDYQTALKWYRRADERGSASAALNIGYHYEKGLGVAVDPKQAIKWYEKAASGRVARAFTNLGLMYQHGEGVAADLDRAISCYQQGAALGDSASENNLGVIAADSPARDYKLAMDHYKKAAAAGNAMAMSNVGFLYLNGRGVSANKLLAIEWFQRAAAAGNKGAQKEVQDLTQPSKPPDAQELANLRRMLRQLQLNEWNAIAADPKTPFGAMKLMVTAAGNGDEKGVQQYLVATEAEPTAGLTHFAHYLTAKQSNWMMAVRRFGERKVMDELVIGPRPLVADVGLEIYAISWQKQADGSMNGGASGLLLRPDGDGNFKLDVTGAIGNLRQTLNVMTLSWSEDQVAAKLRDPKATIDDVVKILNSLSK